MFKTNGHMISQQQFYTDLKTLRLCLYVTDSLSCVKLNALKKEHEQIKELIDNKILEIKIDLERASCSQDFNIVIL